MAYITTEEVKVVRGLVNSISKKYGIKALTKKRDTSSGVSISAVSGPSIAIRDLNIEPYFLENFQELGILESLPSYDEVISLLLTSRIPEERVNEAANAFCRIRKALNQEFEGDTARFVFNENSLFFKWAKEVEDIIKKELDWYDNSDSMSDYFDTKFYLDVDIGRWDKPYKTKIDKKAK